jgi:hypothetical protein
LFLSENQHDQISDEQEIPPSIITEEETTQILEADSSSIRHKVFLYEALVNKYEHPFFMLRLANILFILKSPTMAMQLCIKVCVSFYRKLLLIQSLTAKGSTACK